MANQLVSLHEINERGIDNFLFDGLVCFGEHRRYITSVPFNILSIRRYQDLDTATVGSDMWIKSFEGSESGIWYQLGKPSTEYRRYQKPFLWIADLAKYVVDYLHLRNDVDLTNFVITFA